MTTTLFDLTGRRALVTGSSRGIGYAIATGLADAGASLVLNSRNPDDLEKARASLVKRGATVDTRAFNVSDPDATERAIAEIEGEIGAIDILVNNAGVQRRAPLLEQTPETWRTVMATDLDAVYFVGVAVARRMIERGHGKIINICSLTSEVGRASIAPYTTAKGAVKMLTKSMCAEWASLGIQANGIGPGYFKTELNRALFENPEFDAWVTNRTPARRWGDVAELQGAAVFLASDASSFVNGQVIYVDGGLLSVM